MDETAQMRGLKTAAGVLIGFGALTAVGAWAPASAPLRFLLDLVILPLGDGPDALSQETRLLAAIIGGVIAGWGVMIWRLATGRSLAAAYTVGVISWFGIDSIASVLAGVPANVIGNIGFLALLLWLGRTRPAPVSA